MSRNSSYRKRVKVYKQNVALTDCECCSHHELCVSMAGKTNGIVLWFHAYADPEQYVTDCYEKKMSQDYESFLLEKQDEMDLDEVEVREMYIWEKFRDAYEDELESVSVSHIPIFIEINMILVDRNGLSTISPSMIWRDLLLTGKNKFIGKYGSVLNRYSNTGLFHILSNQFGSAKSMTIRSDISNKELPQKIPADDVAIASPNVENKEDDSIYREIWNSPTITNIIQNELYVQSNELILV